MCGICGKLNFEYNEPVDPKLIQKMMEAIHHRGPDGSGIYCSSSIGLGHRRLSIIDIKTGHQPISNEDNTVWVVYNGEIYNFNELRIELQSKGHKFRSNSDTEVIVHLYEDMGPHCIVQLRGMFAFALWDDRKQLLLLARDRVGIKPLYYINTGRSLVFASEIKSILEDSSVPRRINLTAIDQFLTYHYLPGNETMFEGIYKLEPGHYLTVSNKKIKVQQYWDLRFKISQSWKSFEEAVEALRELLRHTVKDHMISDVPVGVLLSGGVDSTGVLRYAVEETDKPISTFTIGFSGTEFPDERPYARLVAKRFGTNHQEISMTAEDFRDFLPNYVWYMEEPICEPPGVALYFVAHLAQESSVKVLLSGEGGDEAFGGYQNYRNLLLLESLKSAFGPAKGLLKFGLQILGKAGWTRVARYSNLISQSLSEYYLSRTAILDSPLNQLKHKLYKKDFAITLAKQMRSEMITQHLFDNLKGQSALNQMLYVDTKTWLPHDLLVKADKMTMATSIELRVPLLDFQVLEFAASLPPHFKVSGWSTKRILKAALKDSVPKGILNRKKTGFPVPYARWLQKEMQDFVFDLIMGQNSFSQFYFCKKKIRELLQINQRTNGLSREVFCLLVLELWHRKFTRLVI